MLADLKRFFECYRDAFNQFDGDAVARLYALPSGIVDDTGYAHWADFDAIRGNMTALCDLYRADGFERAEFAEAAFIDQGAVGAVVDLSWTIRRKDGAAPRRFNTTYNLIRRDGDWRVQLCTAYQESRLPS